MNEILGYYLVRYRDLTRMVTMSQGVKEWKEPAEYFVLYKDRQLKTEIAHGSTNAASFLSEKYGHGQGIGATNEQIVDALIHDEPI